MSKAEAQAQTPIEQMISWFNNGISVLKQMKGTSTIDTNRISYQRWQLEAAKTFAQSLLPIEQAAMKQIADIVWDAAENRADYIREQDGWETEQPDKSQFITNLFGEADNK